MYTAKVICAKGSRPLWPVDSATSFEVVVQKGRF